MGYQEYLVTARNEQELKKLVGLCAAARKSGLYDTPETQVEPRSVAVFKQTVGLFGVGTHALWVTGERVHGDMGVALLPDGGRDIPRITATPADNNDALGANGDYTHDIDFSDKTGVSENEYMTRYSLDYYYTHFCAPDITAAARDESGPIAYRTLKELRRRLTAEGYEPDLDELGAGSVRDGERSVYVMGDGEIRFKPENRELAYHIRDICEEVKEYMAAFERAAPGVERFQNGGKEDTRTLLLYNSAELAARRLSDDSIDFVTWVHVRGHRDMGHYISGYAAAKEDFAVRAGLINRDRLFTETELTVIRSTLSDYIDTLGGRMSGKDEDTAEGVIRKIDTVIAPEIREQAQETEEQGYEPEQEL
jgi:hypothetical protein